MGKGRDKRKRRQKKLAKSQSPNPKPLVIGVQRPSRRETQQGGFRKKRDIKMIRRVHEMVKPAPLHQSIMDLDKHFNG